jgi:hypothetical protein
VQMTSSVDDLLSQHKTDLIVDYVNKSSRLMVTESAWFTSEKVLCRIRMQCNLSCQRTKMVKCVLSEHR